MMSGRGRRRDGRHGMAWMLGSFVACPCHLPVTLALLTAVLSGTVAGAVLRSHIIVAGLLITAVWALGMGRGVWLLRRPRVCPVPSRSRGADDDSAMPGIPVVISGATDGGI